MIMGSDTSASPPAKRKRSRAGCYTCRRRKKACDSARPVCGSCTRLGIPCVFPKLYRNDKGELVPSPQPNGRTKKLPREDGASPEDIYGSSGGSVAGKTTGASNPWETTPTSAPGNLPWSHSHPSGGSNAYHLDDAEGEHEDLSGALDQFLASLGDSDGHGWAWPVFSDGALELDLGSSPSTSTTTAPSAMPRQPSASAFPTGTGASTPLLPHKMVTAAAVLEHLPALYDYWVNSFSHVLSVLGPGHNPVVNTMLPVVQRSPLVMCALIAWAATHRANVGHPYEDVARLATDTTELQIDQLDIERDLTADEKEEYMWTLLILGGLEIVRGDVRGWVSRLPMTRRLLQKAIDAVDFNQTPTWQSLAYNCVYHDVLACLSLSASPQFPVELYTRILNLDNLEMDSYMGATRRFYPFLMEIAMLAGNVSDALKQPPSPERDQVLGDLLSKHETILGRLRAVSLPAGLFSHALPIGTDRSLLIVAFQTYQLAAELYLRQTILRAASSDLPCRQLGSRILSNMRLLLGTPNESQMMFPLFLAGVSTTHETGRAEIISIFTKFSERVQVRNVFAVVNLLLEVWKQDPDGDRFVDWRQLADKSDVALSFA